MKPGKPLRRSPMQQRPEWLEEARELLEAGLSYQAVGDRVGASRQQAYYWLSTRDHPGRVTRDCPTCGEEFSAYDLRQKYCSPKCFAAREIPLEERQAKAAKMRNRKGRKNPNFKGGHRAGERDRAGERRFKSSQHECQHPDCPEDGWALDQHHVVYEQHVKKEGGDRWSADNALALCHSCHASHHLRGRVLPVSALRDENFAFAYDLMGPAAYDYFRRRYDGEDPRLDALLTQPEKEAA